MVELQTAAEVIDELGGASIVAQLVGRTSPAVRNWRASGDFPATTYLIIRNALAEKGKTAPAALWRMVEPEQVAS
jgi:hypothetical protein